MSQQVGLVIRQALARFDQIQELPQLPPLLASRRTLEQLAKVEDHRLPLRLVRDGARVAGELPGRRYFQRRNFSRLESHPKLRKQLGDAAMIPFRLASNDPAGWQNL